MLEARRVFLVPACDHEQDGELSVLGVRQARALGDALGDVTLWAAYAAPGRAYEETAEAIAQRHGLVVRKRPALDYVRGGTFAPQADRLVQAFEGLARVGPGRKTLIVAARTALSVMLSHCRGAVIDEAHLIPLEPGSLTEVEVEETRYVIVRVADTAHLGPLGRSQAPP